MNYHAHFPSVRLVDNLRNSKKKEDFRRPTNHVRNKSYALELTSSKPSKENIYPANTRTKSKEPSLPPQNSQFQSRLRLSEKGNDIMDLDVPSSPVSHNTKINVINSFNPRNTNFGEFNKNVIKNKAPNGRTSGFSVNPSHKGNNKSSNNIEPSSTNMVKSSNVSYEVNNHKVGKEQSKSSNNLLTNIQVESLEELHFFYVNLLKQNKSLAFKFEGMNSEDYMEYFEI
jgi:hypothetical protein